MQVKEHMGTVLNELSQIVSVVDEQQLEQAVKLLGERRRIFFSGMGRSGNMIKALAIRFLHLGYEAYVAGDAGTPSIQPGDVLVAVSASAKTKVTLNHMEVARRQGATVFLISSLREEPELADYYLCIPAKTEIPSIQHAGSLFEQAVLVIGDSICACLQQKLHVTSELMNRRHANLQ